MTGPTHSTNTPSPTFSTITPTPNQTPTSTQQPQATVTPTTSNMILSHTNYIDSIGYFTVVGEVKNTLSVNINYVKIVATFYDSNNVVIGTDFTFTDVDTLTPNQKSPFELSTYPDKISPSSYKLTVDYSITGNQPFQGLTILSNTPSTDSLGYYKIVGEVQNNGVRDSTYTKIICTFYDSSGNTIDKTFTFTDPSTVSKSSTAPFELSSYPRHITPASYSLQVEGN